MAVNAIGPFNFIELGEPPDLFESQISTHHRAGTDGTMLSDLGTWCEPFEIESLAGAVTFERACQLYLEYKALPAAAPVQVTWAGLQLVAARHLYYVLSVRTVSIDRLILGTGPDGNYFAEIRARWKLSPVRF